MSKSDRIDAPFLKRCPFCGSSAVHVVPDGDPDAHMVECGGDECPVMIVAGPRPTAAEAAADWNHRAEERS